MKTGKRKRRTKKQHIATQKRLPKRSRVRPNPQLGTVISGTLRPEDLVPAFVDALDEVIEDSTFEPGADAPCRVARVGNLQSALGSLERRMGEADYYESEASQWDLDWLFEQLGEFAPEGTYFGAHWGDGADFGFWPLEED